MNSRTAAVYGVGGALLVAYLAAANMPSQDDGRTQERARAADTSDQTTLADEVRSQATRLHARLADAPVPENNPRNPFAFGAVPRVAPARQPEIRAAVADEAPTPVAPPAPALTLMGIAEESVTGGLRRTAIIAGEGDTIFMVTEGESVGDRYKVTKIGADAVELEDLLTKGYRRIAMG